MLNDRSCKEQIHYASHFSNSYFLGLCAALAFKKKMVLMSDCCKGFCLRKLFGRFQFFSVLGNFELRKVELGSVQHKSRISRLFSTKTHPERLSWESSSHAILLKKIESALKGHQVTEALAAFTDFKSLYGFPNRSVLSRLVSELSYSSNSHCLQRACDLVHLISKEKSGLLHPDILTKLSLSLARSQLPEPASGILRLMLQKDNLPSMEVLQLVVLHMVKTEIGTCLASNFLVEICNRFLQLSIMKNDHANLMKPNTMIFNLVLDACVRFKFSLKGQEIMELMSQTGVIADAHSIVIISCLHEMNGQRDELKKFKDYVDQCSAPVYYYQKFYASLLSLHFKFDDMDAAADLVLDMCGNRDSFPIKRARTNSQKPCLVPIGPSNLKAGLKLQVVPELLQKDSVLATDDHQDLVTFRNGRLLPTNKALAKLIYGYKRHGKTAELSKLLVSIQMLFHSLGGSNLCCDVIDACIRLGWLEAAHDILDDMESAGNPMGCASYKSLLIAYYKASMLRDAKALVKQMKKAGLEIDLSDGIDASACLSEVSNKYPSSSVGKSELIDCLVEKIKEKKEILPMVYELNSSLYFFCKAKMIEDALKTYRRMEGMKFQPSGQTFAFLIYGFSSLGMYREITILWGDIKRNVENGTLMLTRDLYELLLMNFIRGGYFERVLEVIGCMERCGMCTDKWMYKMEFLNLHKNLYRSLKASVGRSEVQSKRIEHVQAFRKWVGID